MVPHFLQECLELCLNNGFATSSFAVEREVRLGDPLPAYVFIITLEVLSDNIRDNSWY